jgi:hypothetical protein
MRPQQLQWDGAVSWSLADYTELIIGNSKRTFFYRFPEAVNIYMTPAAQSGAGVALVSTGPWFVQAHVGTRLRYINRQMLITAVADSTHATVTIEESLPGTQVLNFAADPTTTFSVGDVVNGGSSGSKALITSINAGAHQISLQLLSTNATLLYTGYAQQALFAFTAGEIVVGPGGGVANTAAGGINPPGPSPIWDEEVMSPYRGYPASCFVDNGRLGFCNFASVPRGIGWSAVGSPTDLYVGGPTVPNGAIFELAPDNSQVLYVVPGPESSEFVICDHRIYYIKIDVANPLKPGSVGFQILSGDGAARVQPRVSQDFIFYVNAGGNSVMAITAPGAYYRPFNTRNMCDFHSHLFSNIVALAAPNADGTFNERYIYALNANGSMACGKYNSKDGQIADDIGWGPWSGTGAVNWIAATNADVLFTTNYFGTMICEILDDTVYMDGTMPVNAPPVAFAAPPGAGPLWWIPNQSVFLMDQVSRPVGVYQVDGLGNIVPQNNGGENLAAATLMAGQAWTGSAEPFAPDAPSGADQHQRMELRQYSYFGVYVIHSTGFLFASIFSGKRTRFGTVPGTVANSRRVPAYNMDDDTALPPIQRETVEKWTPVGSSYDPRAAIIWDTPGPIQILEFATEVSI